MHTKILHYRRDLNVATIEDLTKMNSLLNNIDIIESSTRKQTNTKWKIYKLTNVTIFAALLKETLLGCKGTVLPDPLLKILSVKCLTYEESTQKPYNNNLCLFRTPALLLHGNEKLEPEIAKKFNFLLQKLVGLIRKLSRCLYGRFCTSGGYCSRRYFLVRF